MTASPFKTRESVRRSIVYTSTSQILKLLVFQFLCVVFDRTSSLAKAASASEGEAKVVTSWDLKHHRLQSDLQFGSGPGFAFSEDEFLRGKHRRLLSRHAGRNKVEIFVGTLINGSDLAPQTLGQSIRRNQLRNARLSFFSVGKSRSKKNAIVDEDEEDVGLSCRGGICPNFKSCGGEFSKVSACWNEEFVDQAEEDLFQKLGCPRNVRNLLPGQLLPSGCSVNGAVTATREGVDFQMWAGQMFLLENVYVDFKGRVFNETHFFDFGGCPNALEREEFVLPKGTKALVYDELLNLLTPGEGNEIYHEIIEKLPLFLPMAKFLPKLRTMPVAMQNRKLIRAVWSSVLGFRLGGMRLHGMGEEELLFVKKLYQPMHQNCHQPSPSLWKHFRENFLLLPDGLPIFDTNGKLRSGLKPKPIAGMVEDWVVVVAKPESSGPQLPDLNVAEKLLVELYGDHRVVVYNGRLGIEDAKQLFNRAILFVGATGISFTNIIFLPPNATILELRVSDTSDSSFLSSSSRPTSKPPPSLYQSLAFSCSLRHFSLSCMESYDGGNIHAMKSASRRITLEVSGDGGGLGRDGEGDVGDREGEDGLLCGGVEKMREALENIQHDIFSSDWFDGRSLDPSGKKFRQGVPGSKLKSAGEIGQFRKWQSCIGHRGKWALNSKPRMLPWEFKGTSNYCDKRHVLKGGIMTKKADDVAIKRKGRWDVRETLKYVWYTPSGVCGQWAPFREAELCRTPRKVNHILLLGDSLQEQFVRVFVNNMVQNIPKPATWAVEEWVPEECEDWIGGKKLKHSYCRVYRLASEGCSNFTVSFLRNDYLQISGNKHVFDRMPWIRFWLLKDADVVVMNRGAHYMDDDHYISFLRSAVRHIRNKYPKKLIIYRYSAPGHANCTRYTKPLKWRQKPEDLPFHWGDFTRQNELARKVVEEVGGVHMDVDKMTALRPDGHQGWIPEIKAFDCLHYCIPGPIDTWAQLLYNILLKLIL